MKSSATKTIASAALGCFLVPVMAAGARAASDGALLQIMQSELDLSMKKLVAPDDTNPYFLQYTVTDQQEVNIMATLGSITANDVDRSRQLDVDVRVGDYTLDNTHQIRGEGFWGGYERWGGSTQLPLNGDPLATRHAIWLATDEKFKKAVKRLAQVKANVKVKVEEEDLSDDFSREDPSVHAGSWINPTFDTEQLAQRVKKCSRLFRAHPLIYNSNVMLIVRITNRLAINSEGSKIQTGRQWWRIGIHASTIAEDGMELWQYNAFDAHTVDGLPSDDVLAEAANKLISEVLALREAPVVDPYTGPAILMSRASGVFFHEIFGHRIEGHRQKDVEEGQTFAKKVGQEILPPFLTIVDDPSQRMFKDIELNGYYQFDDECVPAQPARIVEDGVLKTFLLSRSPTRGFTKSNGHGRRQPGMNVVARQGNLMVQSSETCSFGELRAKLVKECKEQEKEYGLLFTDISGGFTFTDRWMPQAFKVLPILVYKVYADGRGDELVRGVDIVGTPLTCFSQIISTADDPGVFNGVCGAESGMVPVSAISPSILVRQIEVEKKQKAQDRPPILEAPIASDAQ
ncbi:MAG: hypothetical protein JSU63_10210 [Phycisphaerales bacterium]|nr:MAG: hypothetical protein JSU63_10210 [Phycisphaerales bacterium]